jgi:osmotically-inducible protein OsmY
MKQIGLGALAGAVAGALGALFLDPQSGRRRRRQLVQRTAGFFRRGTRRTVRAAHGVAADVGGLTHKAAHLREQPKEQPNDATLAAKVESEVFRDAEMPKGQVDVNAENGVVVLRGEVERPELIEELERRVRKVQGVMEVENLLHLPGSDAPMHQSHSVKS